MTDYSDVIARLHHAFRWDCDGCGRENFVRAISLEQEYIECKFNTKIDDDSQHILYPAIVVCGYCKAQYLSSFNEFDGLEEEGTGLD